MFCSIHCFHMHLYLTLNFCLLPSWSISICSLPWLLTKMSHWLKKNKYQCVPKSQTNWGQITDTVATIFCDLTQVKKVIVSRPSLGNLLFRNPLFSTESVSNVDRLWNIYSLTADHIRVLLFVSFCIPPLICQWYSFLRKSVNQTSFSILLYSRFVKNSSSTSSKLIGHFQSSHQICFRGKKGVGQG